MSNALGAFDALIRERIAPLMREHGFRKQRNTFWIRGDGTWGVINFQKSQWNTSDRMKFTINVGVEADVLRRMDVRQDQPPHFTECSIYYRIGVLVGHGDEWWELRGGDDLSPVADQVQEVLTSHAIPFVKQFPNQHSLQLHWSRVLATRPEPAILWVRFPTVARFAELLGDESLAALTAEAARERDARVQRARESASDNRLTHNP